MIVICASVALEEKMDFLFYILFLLGGVVRRTQTHTLWLHEVADYRNEKLELYILNYPVLSKIKTVNQGTGNCQFLVVVLLLHVGTNK